MRGRKYRVSASEAVGLDGLKREFGEANCLLTELMQAVASPAAKVDARNGLLVGWLAGSRVLSYGAFAQRMSRRAALLLTCKKDKSRLISGIDVWMWIVSSGQKEQ